jgi:hypothetical protein
LELRIDNYYAKDSRTEDGLDWIAGEAGVGEIANGNIYNHNEWPASSIEGLVEPNDIGGRLFHEEGAFGFIDNNHSGVHQWYRWTIDPNHFSYTNDNEQYCVGDVIRSFNISIFYPMDNSLNPCNSGWFWALNGPHPEMFPAPNGRSVRFEEQPIPIVNFEEHGCIFQSGTIIQCREQSSPYALMDIDIPVGTTYVEIEYNFINRGDGDYVSVLIDGIPIWTLKGDSVVGDGYIRTGPLPISQDLVGQHKMTVALYGLNELNAEIELRNFNAISVEEIVPVPGDLDGDADIDNIDFSIFYASFGSCNGSASFNEDADYDADGCVTFIDYQTWYGYYMNQ